MTEPNDSISETMPAPIRSSVSLDPPRDDGSGLELLDALDDSVSDRELLRCVLTILASMAYRLEGGQSFCVKARTVDGADVWIDSRLFLRFEEDIRWAHRELLNCTGGKFPTEAAWLDRCYEVVGCTGNEHFASSRDNDEILPELSHGSAMP